AQALAQGLEGDLLVLHLGRRRQFEEDSLRAVWDVDVNEILRVEGVNLALTGSHDGWGEDEEGQEVETEVPRAAEAGLYTWGDKGRLCALVCAQLVRAQHADAALGAVDNDASISGM
ncbi:hypothetical protein POSPLADRAFT_1152801, partial [Postia placenta MAD-698-R-SB12]